MTTDFVYQLLLMRLVVYQLCKLVCSELTIAKCSNSNKPLIRCPRLMITSPNITMVTQ